jgi:hypothetical protein
MNKIKAQKRCEARIRVAKGRLHERIKKEFGLGLLLVVISAITGAINPAFLSRVNLPNKVNLIGFFGVFALPGVGVHRLLTTCEISENG